MTLLLILRLIIVGCSSYLIALHIKKDRPSLVLSGIILICTVVILAVYQQNIL